MPAEAIVDDTMRSLAAEIEAAGARVEHDALPVIYADPVLIGQVFQNLVANAVKFRDDEPPVVHVSGRELADSWEFTVQDNGIGIPPERRRADLQDVPAAAPPRPVRAAPASGCRCASGSSSATAAGSASSPWLPDRGSRFVFTIATHDRRRPSMDRPLAASSTPRTTSATPS